MKRRDLTGEKDRDPEKFRQLNRKETLYYIWDYYKFHFLALLIVTGFLVSFVHDRATKKDPLLFTAFVNVSFSETFSDIFTVDLLEKEGYDTEKYEIYTYENLYIADDSSDEDHQYEYASRIKATAAINSKQLDTVIMDQRAFDIFSSSGYLYDLSELQPSLKEKYSEQLVSSENAEDYNTGFLLTGCSALKDAGITAPVFFGIIKNSERTEFALTQLNFFLEP